jgi:mycothiol synthase
MAGEGAVGGSAVVTPPPADVASDPPATSVLTWRPLDPSLVSLWHPLVAAIVEADDGTEHLGPDDLRDELASDWLDLRHDSVLGIDDDGVARAFGLVQVRPGDVTLLRASLWGGVHPRWRGRGIGRALLAWQERRARAIVAQRRTTTGGPHAEADVPATATFTVDEHVEDAARLADRAGYRPLRWYFVMRRDLSTPVPEPVLPGPAAAAGLRLVSFAEAVRADPALDDAVRRAHNDAFAEHWSFQPWDQKTWRQWETGHRDFRGDWSFLILADHQVVGYALSAAYAADWAAQGFTEGWTSKLGVRPTWRGQGLAKVLLAASMRAFAEAGMQYAGLDVDSANPTGAVALYTGLGYEVRRRSAHWSKSL